MFALSTFLSCGLIIEDDDELHLIKKDNNSGKLKLDGVYIHETTNSNGPLFSRWFLYQDGVINEAGTTTSLFDLGPPYITDKEGWGLYVIEGDIIKIEKWYLVSSNGIGPIPYYAYTREGNVLNDTCFHIKKSYRIQNGKQTEERNKDEIYKFIKYQNKPDSSLSKQFIK